MSGKVTKLGRICVEGLNEDAALAFAGGCYLSRRPSSPTLWFFTLAIDGNAHTWGPNLRALLSDESKQLLELVDIADFAKATDYCTCIDEALTTVPFLAKHPEYRDRCAPPCYPCAFGAHDRCSFGCSSVGEIHFPERIIDPQVKKLAA